MPINVANGREEAGAGYIAKASYMSLHTAVPGSGGANEVVGGSPAYARLPVSWTAKGGGSWTATLPKDFDVPTGVTVAYIGLWDSLTGGEFIDYSSVAAATYAAQGTFKATSITFTMS